MTKNRADPMKHGIKIFQKNTNKISRIESPVKNSTIKRPYKINR